MVAHTEDFFQEMLDDLTADDFEDLFQTIRTALVANFVVHGVNEQGDIDVWTENTDTYDTRKSRDGFGSTDGIRTTELVSAIGSAAAGLSVDDKTLQFELSWSHSSPGVELYQSDEIPGHTRSVQVEYTELQTATSEAAYTQIVDSINKRRYG